MRHPEVLFNIMTNGSNSFLKDPSVASVSQNDQTFTIIMIDMKNFLIEEILGENSVA